MSLKTALPKHHWRCKKCKKELCVSGNQHDVELLSFWPEVSVQKPIVIDFYNFLIVDGIWTYMTLCIHRTSGCYISVVKFIGLEHILILCAPNMRDLSACSPENRKTHASDKYELRNWNETTCCIHTIIEAALWASNCSWNWYSFFSFDWNTLSSTPRILC